MNDDPAAPQSRSRKKLLIGGAVTVFVTAGIVVAFVLPAEYGIDPTGLGRATGLVEMANPTAMTELERGARRTGVLTVMDKEPTPESGMSDKWEFELGPYEAVEFKYTISEGQRMAFTWQSTGLLYFDMHAHPFEGGVDLTESYGVGEAAVMHGRYVAPFTGIHGWYWQNRSLESTRLSLAATGRFSSSTVFDVTGEHSRPLTLVDE